MAYDPYTGRTSPHGTRVVGAQADLVASTVTEDPHAAAIAELRALIEALEKRVAAVEPPPRAPRRGPRK